MRDKLMARDAVEVVFKNRTSAIDDLIAAVGHHLELSKPRVLVLDHDEDSLKRICDIVGDGVFRALRGTQRRGRVIVLDDLRDTELC